MVQRVAKVMHNNLLKGRGMRDFSKEKILDKFSVDIELTNACNASCSFCPRDKMPDIGTIKGTPPGVTPPLMGPRAQGAQVPQMDVGGTAPSMGAVTPARSAAARR